MSARLSRRSFLTAAAGVVAAANASSARAERGSGPSAARFEVERFVEDVKVARRESDSQRAIQEILERAVSDPHAVLEGIGEPSEVGIRTLYRAPDLTILNVVWAPLMVLLPHNHNMWATIGIYTGREDNIVWDRQGDVIEASGAASLSEKEVFALPVDAIHSVTNPIPRMTGAIHIYGGDFFAVPRSEWDSETLHERPMDLKALQKRFQDANERFKRGQQGSGPD
jgi:predicted metal-dependent enzyme (double-stranded beta helix superfamily)